MAPFAYPCPDCSSELAVHHPNCSFASVPREQIERGYIDIISLLHIAPRPKERFIEQCDWSDLHESCLQTLIQQHHVTQKENGKYRLLTADEKRRHIHPTSDPLRTIYTYGTVPGCHDNGIFSLIAYYTYQGLSWEDTKEIMLSWFDDTGTWDRGGFSQSSPKEVLGEKLHVHENGYGWSRTAQMAKQVIDAHKNVADSSAVPEPDSSTNTTSSTATP